ncbi:hypothetical protein [Halalkalicoccus jeotgali]|uniref:Uncharacterized protein n=1 Tax=Halalkalicoccus jeotgali (strain DSM 18796 / CECT 7217 / JCM 14584 / KCTC 4019 / B3) TaxID=795797 RepID=D8J9L0_HALJB|nr:hypothetical protein [Halalkalicoccus jeotgali]ADJ14422.1 hypothetical protein HacjB3_05155 [Halalkalicoccus jeotgali B3]ELY40138.1 hypothetical protein C497_03540 [Halalkalicoccus jeotgali B3]
MASRSVVLECPASVGQPVPGTQLRWDEYDHSIERWDERTPHDSVSPDRALRESVAVGREGVRQYFRCEEVRIFGQSDLTDVWYPYLAIFPIREGVVRTVLLAERVVATTIRAHLWTVWGDAQ